MSPRAQSKKYFRLRLFRIARYLRRYQHRTAREEAAFVAMAQAYLAALPSQEEGKL